MSTYIHKQETWSEAECMKRARHAPKDHWGNRPPPGLINHSASSYPEYGQTVRFNGGCVREGEWYQAEAVPLPVIPDGWEFVPLCSWGPRIQRKEET